MDEYCYECGQNSRRCYRCYPPTRRQVLAHADSSCKLSLYSSLESGDLADVEFSVECPHFPGEQATFKAHKMIMAVQNEVFRAMFYGNFAKEDRIVITDLHPEGFRGLLGYLYSGRLDVSSVHQAACTRTAAAKYLVPELEKKMPVLRERPHEGRRRLPFPRLPSHHVRRRLGLSRKDPHPQG